jgi:hypothetical protein
MSWNTGLKPVQVQSQIYEPVASSDGVGLFYAGGVDSSYSLISHIDEVDLLVLTFGFDFTMSEDDMKQSIVRNGTFAKRLGKALVSVETNHSRFVTSLGVSRSFMFSATLASIGLLLGLRKCFIASGHSAANMRPDGSHPVLDFRFSNGVTEVVHDDVSVSRLEKTWAVARHPDILENLRVCWESHNKNCGHCSKCLRTMTALKLRGIEGPFPRVHDIRRIGTMAANTEREYVISMFLAAKSQGDSEVARQLKKGLRRQDWKEALRHIDYALLGGRLQRLRRRFLGAEAQLVKANLRPDLDS